MKTRYYYKDMSNHIKLDKPAILARRLMRDGTIRRYTTAPIKKITQTGVLLTAQCIYIPVTEKGQ